MRRLPSLLVLAVTACIAVGTASAEIGYRGWGPRVGVSDDPDQVIFGAHVDLGEFAPSFRLQPSVEIGLGDDVTSIAGNCMAAYFFREQGRFTPYLGGQITLAFFDLDREGRDDSETEIGAAIVGGIEMPFQGKTRFLTELQIGFGDIHDFKMMAGWKF